jgi:hypothetical protein
MRKRRPADELHGCKGALDVGHACAPKPTIPQGSQMRKGARAHLASSGCCVWKKSRCTCHAPRRLSLSLVCTEHDVWRHHPTQSLPLPAYSPYPVYLAGKARGIRIGVNRQSVRTHTDSPGGQRNDVLRRLQPRYLHKCEILSNTLTASLRTMPRLRLVSA